MAKDWFPERKAERNAWYQNFKAQVTAIATALKLDATAALAAIADYLTKDAAHDTARTVADAASQAAQTAARPAEDAVRAFVKQLKASPAATAAQQELLRCFSEGDADATTTRVAAQRPVLELGSEGGHIVVKFKKLGHQGVLIYARRGAETEFTLLGLDTQTPYYDNRPNLTPGQAEDRHYRAYFAERDAAVGEVSDVATLAVAG